jgi:hypothetical protein
MFRALPCPSSGGVRRNCIYAASGIVTVCKWLSCEPVKKRNLSYQIRQELHKIWWHNFAQTFAGLFS